MIRRHGKTLRAVLMLADGALAALIGLLAYQALAHPGTAVGPFFDAFWVRAVLYGVVWVVLLYINGAYRMRAHWTIGGEAASLVRATFWLALLGTMALFVSAEGGPATGWVLLLFPLQGLLAIALRAVMRWAFMRARHSGYNVRNMLILGTGREALEFSQLLSDHSFLGVRVVGYLGDRAPEGVPPGMHWGPVSELPRVLRERVIDEVAVALDQTDRPDLEELLLVAHEEGKLIRVPLRLPHLRGAEHLVEDLDGTAVLTFTSGPEELTGHILKRAFDIAVSAASLVLLSPLLLAIALVIRVREGPGILFRQSRVGLHGRPFTIYKFRTMTLDAEERYPGLANLSDTSGPAFKLVADPRVTPTGRWLRRYSLDELPQLVNVLKGEMSIVGPRPAPQREVDGYDVWHRRRLSMKPGITGLWQITSRLDRDFDDRAELDLAYIDRWSLRLDLTIVLRTIPALLRRPGH